MNIIGINGFKRSGKGETGNAIAELLPGVKLLGFADKLKIFAAKSLGFTDLSDAECIALMDEAKEGHWLEYTAARHNDDWFSSRTAPGTHRGWFKKQLSVRQLLQHMGTEARTVFGDDFWVDQVLPRPFRNGLDNTGQLQERYPNVETLAFTDLRFENEARRIIDLGGYNIEVVRPGTTSDGHASEQVLDRRFIEYQIVNCGTLDDLRWEVNKVLELEGLIS